MEKAAQGGAFDNQREDLVRRTERRYLEAFEDVRVSVEHTATEGWQRLYQGHQSELKAQRLAIGKVMAGQAETLDVRLMVEDEEKEAKDAVKQNAELRAFEAAWEKQVLRPITEPVTRCADILENARAAADREERNAPLVNIGLCDVLEQMIQRLPKATWDDRSGRVTVTNKDDETGG